jgi:hypothetical protein
VPVTTDPASLLTPQGAELLGRLAAHPQPDAAASPLALAERLRREYPAGLVAAAMAQQELRRTAAAKFSRAAEMLFTRAGYEQSSSEMIARYRAGRLRNARRVADLCCGIGGDLIALTAASDVLAVDRDETHVRLARYNAGVYGRAERVTAVAADVRDVPLAGTDAVFIDPARRSGPGAASPATAPRGTTGSASAERRFRAGTSEPPLDWCVALTGQVAAVCIKAAPGIPAELIPPDWEAEFIADARDLKEAVLWSPALAAAPPATAPDGAVARRRATVLAAAPGGQSLRSYTLVACPGAPVPLREPGEYLLDPNPAVTRAGLVAELGRAVGARKIDERIAFLAVDAPVTTPFARTLRVLDSGPWREKELPARLRALDVGAVDVRRRGLAGDVDVLRRRLARALSGGTRRATLVMTRVDDRPWALICVDPDP